jgi:hypothetical protein
MFHIDPNVNAAVERQRERVRAVRAFRGGREAERYLPENSRPQLDRRRAALALAAAAPVILLVAAVVLLVR